MKDKQKTKTAMARELRTSRWYLNRILDPRYTTVTLPVHHACCERIGEASNRHHSWYWRPPEVRLQGDAVHPH